MVFITYRHTSTLILALTFLANAAQAEVLSVSSTAAEHAYGIEAAIQLLQTKARAQRSHDEDENHNISMPTRDASHMSLPSVSSSIRHMSKEVVAQVDLAFQQELLSGSQDKNKYSADLVDVYQLPECGPEHAVHVAFVVCGTKAIHEFHTVLKSILAQRTSYLTVHVVTDGPSMPLLNDMLVTWELPLIDWQFYDIERFDQELQDIPTQHEASVFASSKLLYERILANTSRVIALDLDLILNTDITLLWKQFELFDQDQIFGLVAQQSPWYDFNVTGGTSPRWPAVGRGVNTGVWLIDLEKARGMNWYSMWKNALKDGLSQYGRTFLPDQDLTNYAIVQNPEIVYYLPCTWNLQAHNTSVDLVQCLKEMPGPFIVNWNHPGKFDEPGIPNGDLFLSLLQYYQKADGYGLRSGVLSCLDFTLDDPDSATLLEYGPMRGSMEFSMQQASSLHYRILPFYFPSTNQSASVPTLVTTLTMERLSIIPYLLANWPGPISASLYISDADIPEFEEFSRFTGMSARDNLAIHLVMKSDDIFPINKMRSVAMKYALTDMLFTVDVDLIPGPHVFQNLRRHIDSLKRGQALSVPAFESDSYSLYMPQTKEEVLQQVDAGMLRGFRVREVAAEHDVQRFAKWREESQSYSVEWQSNFEPFVLLNRSDAPTYNEHFVGFNQRRTSFVEDLHNKGIEFITVPDCYLVHYPHGPSRDLVLYRKNERYRYHIDHSM